MGEGIHSLSESQESDSLSPHQQHIIDSHIPSNPLNQHIEFKDDEEETSDDGTVDGDDHELKETEDFKDRQIERLQFELKHMSAQMMALMESVKELSSQNEDLEISKVNLVSTTAKAMDECRNTVRDLNRQNLHLLRLLNEAQKT